MNKKLMEEANKVIDNDNQEAAAIIESIDNTEIEKPSSKIFATKKSVAKRLKVKQPEAGKSVAKRRLTKVSESNIYIMKTVQKNRRINIMVIGAACGLIFCLLMLTTYKNDLPGEIVGIVSTIAGIFGACLKDAYSSEFGSSIKKEVPPDKRSKGS